MNMEINSETENIQQSINLSENIPFENGIYKIIAGILSALLFLLTLIFLLLFMSEDFKGLWRNLYFIGALCLLLTYPCILLYVFPFILFQISFFMLSFEISSYSFLFSQNFLLLYMLSYSLIKT